MDEGGIMAGNKNFGKHLKKIREAKGYSQEDLAELVGLEYQTISRIETGYYFTSYENLENIAKALNVKIKDLFDFEENTMPQKNLIDDIQKNLLHLNNEQLQVIKKLVDIMK